MVVPPTSSLGLLPQGRQGHLERTLKESSYVVSPPPPWAPPQRIIPCPCIFLLTLYDILVILDNRGAMYGPKNNHPPLSPQAV